MPIHSRAGHVVGRVSIGVLAFWTVGCTVDHIIGHSDDASPQITAGNSGGFNGIGGTSAGGEPATTSGQGSAGAGGQALDVDDPQGTGGDGGGAAGAGSGPAGGSTGSVGSTQ